MKKLFSLLLLTATLTSFGQEKSKVPLKDRLVFSGDVALSFSNFGSTLGANPTVGYRVNDWLTSGIGAHYYYFSNSFSNTSLYGSQIFTRAEVFDGAFVITELQQTNTEVYRVVQPTNPNDPVTFSAERQWIPQWYVGGGYYQNVGGNIRIGGSILFDIIDDIDSPWSNPQLRGGVIIGI